jgi:Protein of unknown function (DUF574).
MTIQDDCPPGRLVKFNPRLPSSARVTAYWLGGKDALEADRAEADRVSTVAFEVPNMLRAHRDFLCRAVEFLARSGVDQFVEIGCGLPTPRQTCTRWHGRSIPKPGWSTQMWTSRHLLMRVRCSVRTMACTWPLVTCGGPGN